MGEELVRLFTSYLRIRYYLKVFRIVITVVLRKHSKLDYSDPLVYRLIALLNTLGKVLESLVAKRISKIAERY